MQRGEVFCAPVDIFLNKKNPYQLDIIFITQERKDLIEKKGIFGAPDLVVEILSEDRNYDLVKKKSVYEQSGVKECWVEDPETK
jgi:Uma2 family endonuclease